MGGVGVEVGAGGSKARVNRFEMSRKLGIKGGSPEHQGGDEPEPRSWFWRLDEGEGER